MADNLSTKTGTVYTAMVLGVMGLTAWSLDNNYDAVLQRMEATEQSVIHIESEVGALSSEVGALAVDIAEIKGILMSNPNAHIASVE